MKKSVDLQIGFTLFRVETAVREYDGRKDVRFDWFRSESRDRRPHYADLIENYDPTKKDLVYSEIFIEGLFTKDEAEQLKAYLDKDHGHEGTTKIIGVRTPIPNYKIGSRSIPVGGGSDHYLLHQERGYTLPLKVEGFFDLRGCQKVDGSGMYRGFHYVLHSDGSFRRAENRPAETG